MNVAADSILKVNASMHMAEASSAELKCGKKKKGSKRDGKRVAIGVNEAGNKIAKAKSKRKCYHCGKAGHWLRNCPKYLALKRQANNGSSF